MINDRFRVMAIDYGTKRMGIAISDEGRMLASARGTILNTAHVIPTLVKTIATENIRTVVLGIPMTLANTESDMTRKVKTFEQKLRSALEAVGVILITRDERLTSVIAGSNVASRGMKKSRR